jgi:hypothetical protein
MIIGVEPPILCLVPSMKLRCLFVRRQNLSDTLGDLLREALVAPKHTKMNYTLEPASAS